MFLGVFKSVAWAVGFDDVDAMGDAVKQGAGESLVDEDFGPLFKGQVGGHDDASAFVGAADDFEEEFGPGLAEGDVAELVEDEQVKFFEPSQESIQFSVFSGFK